jgi:hypothetical protein
MTDYDNYDFWNPGEPDLYKDMEDGERIATTICHIAGMVICFVIMLGLCAMCSSCTTTQYVPVVEHHTDTLVRYSTSRDSIFVRDSVHVRDKGDTVRIERWHIQYRDRWRTDTIYQATHDSIPVPYPVTKYVERKLTFTQKSLMMTGAVAVMALILFIAVRLKNYLL